MVWKFPTSKYDLKNLKIEKILRKKDNIREGDGGTQTRAIGECTINF